MSKTRPNANPLIFIVTPVHNGKDLTEKFLESLERQKYSNFRIVIVDDGSTDGTSKMIKTRFPNTILLNGNGNLWWSGGTNKGVRYALKHKVDYILTINNDVEIPSMYLEALVKASQREPEALWGSLVCYSNDHQRVWFAGAYFNYRKGQMLHHAGVVKDFKGDIESDWLTGMGVLIPSNVFLKIGFYDQKNFPQYFGDADFSLRAKQAGHKLMVTTKAKVYGDMDSSWMSKQLANPKWRFWSDLLFSIRSPYHLKSRSLFYRKYWGKNWRVQLFLLYVVNNLPLYWSWFATIMKKYLGIKHFKQLVWWKK